MSANGHDPDADPSSLDVSLLPPDGGNPWEFLKWAKNLALADRHMHIESWLKLVGACPPAERDALVGDGRDCFKYAVGTIRARLKELTIEQGVKHRFVPSLTTDNYVANMVYRPKEQPHFGFLMQRFDAPPGFAPEFVETLEDQGVTFGPLATQLIEYGTVLVPSGIEEYGTDHDLFLEIRAYINTYLQLDDPEFRTLVICYIIMSWVFELFDALPYLRAIGDLGVGKSRLLQVVGSACYHPVLAGGAITPSPIFRVIDRFCGTLVLDEMDFEKSDQWQEILKILLAGYQRGFPVLRAERATEGEPFDVRAYDVFGPKILATRRRFHDAALESRCLSHTMLPVTVSDTMPLNLDKTFRAAAQRMRNRLCLWRLRNYATVKIDSSLRIKGVEPRVNQIIQPILACVTDKGLRDVILKQVKRYSERVQMDRRDTLEGMIATTAVTYWLSMRRPERFTLKTVTESLRSKYELKEISDRKVGDVMRNALGVDTNVKGGVTWVLLDQSTMARLAARYSVDTAQYPGGAA